LGETYSMTTNIGGRVSCSRVTRLTACDKIGSGPLAALKGEVAIVIARRASTLSVGQSWAP
jgi:hypothetical protein